MSKRRLCSILIWGLGLTHAPAAAQPPLGQSARLFGVHDAAGAGFVQGATSSCDKGWITDLRYLDGGAHTIAPPAGVSLIMRLDWNGAQSAPLDGGERGTYADRFVETVERSPNVHVWIVGNEPNVTISGDPPWTPLSQYMTPYIEPFVDNYARVRDRVHSVGGHGDDAVLLPAPSPWSPCFLEGFARIIRDINGRGVDIDGFAIHPGTRHPDDSQRGERVTSGARAPGNCEVGYTESADQYRVFQDFVRVVDENGHSSKPLFITESAHNTDVPVVNHVDEDRGFFVAMYAEVSAWNAANGNRIRALTPYRWERFGDGSGRDHSIRDKTNLQADLLRGATHTWTTPTCEPTGGDCRDDSECTSTQLCQDAGCVDARPCPCASGEVCRADTHVCVPATRGIASITFEPAAPVPGDTARVDVFATTGYTNIALEWEGPLGTGGTPGVDFVDILSGVHWLYDAAVPAAGTYRATFTADPSNTVYGIAYLRVNAPGSDAGPATDAGAGDAGASPGDATVVAPDGSVGADGGGSEALTSGCACRVDSSRASPLALPLLVLFALRMRWRRNRE